MSRCICCDSILPASTVYRTILVPHETEIGQTTTMRIEEDFCGRCASKSNMNYLDEDGVDFPLEDLGIYPELSDFE